MVGNLAIFPLPTVFQEQFFLKAVLGILCASCGIAKLWLACNLLEMDRYQQPGDLRSPEVFAKERKIERRERQRMNPSIGRIVIFTAGPNELQKSYPAIITSVGKDVVDLELFGHCHKKIQVGIKLSASPLAGCWSWPVIDKTPVATVV